MSDFSNGGRNHKVLMHRALLDRGYREWERIVRSKIKQKYKRVKINTTALWICEIGIKIGNRNCKGRAYRRVFTRFGNKWTCDNCSRKIALDNESRWQFYLKA